MKGRKPKMLLIALVGAVAFVIARRATGGGLETVETDEEDRGIDTVSTRDGDAEADDDGGSDLDDDEAADEAEEADEDGTLGSDLEVRAVEKALDSFDYLAIGAAGAKAAYEEYRERAS